MPDPILWTKMGSTAELDTPELGSLITRSGFADFRACKFDNGSSGVVKGDYVKYNSTGMDTTKGCIECWLIFVTQDVVSGIYIGPPILRGVFSIGSGAIGSSLGFLISGSGREAYGHEVYVNGGAVISVQSSINITKNIPYHAAVVWDNSGIDGSGDKLRLYIDGVQKGASPTQGGPSSLGSAVVGGLMWNLSNFGFYSPSGYECAIDNFKAWDYAKTDFSDRFTEDGLGGAKRLFSNKYFGG